MPTMSMSASEAKLTTLIPFLLPASDPKLTSKSKRASPTIEEPLDAKLGPPASSS